MVQDDGGWTIERNVCEAPCDACGERVAEGDPSHRGVHDGWLCFVQWSLTFVGFQCETCLMSPCGRQEFWGGWTVRRSNPVGDEIFLTSPFRPWDPSSFLYNGYRFSVSGIQRPGRGVDHPPLPRAEVKEGVKLYLYSPSGFSWPVVEWNLL
jgi:hypothetical protein